MNNNELLSTSNLSFAYRQSIIKDSNYTKDNNSYSYNSCSYNIDNNNYDNYNNANCNSVNYNSDNDISCNNSNVDYLYKNINITVNKGDFILLYGESGTGKTTLLRSLTHLIKPVGLSSGEIIYSDDLSELTSIGYVFQKPTNCIVNKIVFDELCFGLSSLNLNNETIAARVAEISSFLSLDSILYKDTSTLSEGQKQLVNLASVLVMRPKLLLLDEPTAYFDPISANRFMQLLQRINNELSLTIIISEHNLDNILHMINKVYYIHDSKKKICSNTINYNTNNYDCNNNCSNDYNTSCTHNDNTNFTYISKLSYNTISTYDVDEFINKLFTSASLLKYSLPAYCSFYCQYKLDTDNTQSIPKTLNSAVKYFNTSDNNFTLFISKVTLHNSPNTLKDYFEYFNILFNNYSQDNVVYNNLSSSKKPLFVANGIVFKYRYGDEYIIDDLDINCFSGEWYSIFGSNASGKTTLAKILAGIYKPIHGKIKTYGSYKIGYMPQEPLYMFSSDTLYEDLHLLNPSVINKEFISEIINKYPLFEILRKKMHYNPLDLSGGELQIAGLLKLILLDSKILILDEPTKGLDYSSKLLFARALKMLTNSGLSVLMITHDVEYSAIFADRCSMMFNKQLITTTSVRDFFNDNYYYTTNALRLSTNISWLKKSLTTKELFENVHLSN